MDGDTVEPVQEATHVPSSQAQPEETGMVIEGLSVLEAAYPFFQSCSLSIYISHRDSHTYIYMCLFVCVYFGLGGGSWDF